MARGEITGKKISGADPREPQPVPTFAMSIPQFCTAHNISEGFYYKLKKQKLNSREMKVGTRTLITFEAAAKWRAEREAASTAPPEKQERAGRLTKRSDWPQNRKACAQISSWRASSLRPKIPTRRG